MENPRVTYDPEDVMDERERDYEQATTQREETPLGAAKNSGELQNASDLPVIPSNPERSSSSSSPSVKKSAKKKKKSKAKSKKSGRNKK